ncbi:MAG: sigma-54 dependent transcriptional regulator [Desulfobulbaceae bacterium]|nr:sigma-54 dependent transcriptional regulator [Desulfobulbaceae bacterium]HIJ91628.1 sigma-54-dependent Fis family transcriptional regulator [Deltaproteobacteria bacterium]
MYNCKILLAEDDEIMRITLSDRLRKNGWLVDEACDGREALTLLKKNSYNLLISDIRMPHIGGEDLLAEVLLHAPSTDVIFMTAYGSVEDAVQCLKKGAADYLLKPFDMDDLVIRVKRLIENQAIKVRCASLEQCCRQSQKPLIGSSPPIRALLHLIAQVAPSDATVLITGESGTGKELVASAIHYSSPRAQGPFVRVNCAAIPEGLMESELFGHEKGAFTGADTRKIGRFEMATNGTILLDEIGELPLHLQAKLLRVLQEREIERVGGGSTIRIDVRVLCATAKKLLTEVREGRFREDLYYRLQVIPIAVPPLRERKEDIPELCDLFFKEFDKSHSRTQTLSPAALKILMAYDYPGNVRELRNIIERVTVLNPSTVVEPWLLPADLAKGSHENEDHGPLPMKLADAIAAAERSCIMRALEQTGGKKSEAAQLLGICRKNLWEKMKTHRIED